MSKPIKATLCCIALVGAAACTTNPAAEREATCVGGTVAGAAVRPKFGYFCDIGPVNFVPRPKVQGVQESTAVCSPEQVLQQYCSGSSLHMLATLLLQSENSAE